VRPVLTPPVLVAQSLYRAVTEADKIKELKVETEPGMDVLALEVTDIMEQCTSKSQEIGIDSTCTVCDSTVQVFCTF
jgi:hypothetical protein